MASPASFLKHPIHVILVPFPLGLWTFSFVCDLVNLFGWGGPVWKEVAYNLREATGVHPKGGVYMRNLTSNEPASRMRSMRSRAVSRK